MKAFLSDSVFWGAVLSLLGYEAGLLLKRKFKMAVFNPLLIGVICVMGVLAVGHIDYDSYYEGWQVYQLPSDTGNGMPCSAFV